MTLHDLVNVIDPQTSIRVEEGSRWILFNNVYQLEHDIGAILDDLEVESVELRTSSKIVVIVHFNNGLPRQ